MTLNQFIEALAAKTKAEGTKWELWNDTHIRAPKVERISVWCPITFVLGDESYAAFQFSRAAERLGLTLSDSNAIVTAADDVHSRLEGHDELRGRLMGACFEPHNA